MGLQFCLMKEEVLLTILCYTPADDKEDLKLIYLKVLYSALRIYYCTMKISLYLGTLGSLEMYMRNNWQTRLIFHHPGPILA